MDRPCYVADVTYPRSFLDLLALSDHWHRRVTSSYVHIALYILLDPPVPLLFFLPISYLPRSGLLFLLGLGLAPRKCQVWLHTYSRSRCLD